MSANNRSISHLQEVYIPIFFIGNDREYIDIGNFTTHNGRFSLVVLQTLYFLFDEMRFFKTHFGSQCHHFLFKMLECFFEISFENFDYLLDIIVIILFALVSFTRSFTIF